MKQKKRKQSHHLFCFNKKYYLFEKESGNFFRINRESFEQIGKMKTDIENAYINQRIKQNTNKYKNSNNSLQESDKKIAHKYSKNPIYNLNIIVSQACNLKCNYCYSLYYRRCDINNTEVFMNKETAKKIIDTYIDYNKNKNYKFFSIAFAGGGEPLTNYNIIKYIIEYCNHKKRHENLLFNYKIPTNGLLLDEEKLMFFMENNVRIKISIDGNEKDTNLNRLNNKGNGIYDKLITKIKLAQKILSQDNLIAAITFTKLNKNFVEIIKHIKDLGFKNIKFQFAADKDLFITKKDWPQTKKELVKLVNFFIDYVINSNNIDEICNFETFNYAIKQIIQKKKKEMPCVGGLYDLAVSPQGFFSLCTRTIGLANFQINSKSDYAIDEFRKSYFENYNLNHRVMCKGCWISSYCAGYCNHLNILFNNSPFTPYEPMCNIRKFYYEAGIYMIDNFINYKPDILKKILAIKTY